MAFNMLSGNDKEKNLFEKLKAALIDTETGTQEEQLSIKRLSMLVGLYQYLPNAN